MERKKRVWGNVLVVEPRETYYSLPIICIEGNVIEDKEDYLKVKLPNHKIVSQARCNTLCIGKKGNVIQALFQNFQDALESLKIEIAKLKKYNLSPTSTVILAENPLQPSSCNWDFWEVDYVVRAQVLRSTDQDVVLDILDETGRNTVCPKDSVFACQSEQEWQNIYEKYTKLLQVQKYFVNYLNSLPSYDEKLRKSRKLKLVDTRLSSKMRELKDAIIANPDLSLRSIGRLVGLSGTTTNRYFRILQELNLLTEEEKRLIAEFQEVSIKKSENEKITPVVIEISVEENPAYQKLLAENKELKERFSLLAAQIGVSQEIALKLCKLEEMQLLVAQLQKEVNLLRQKEALPRQNRTENTDNISVAEKIRKILNEAESKQIFRGSGLASVRICMSEIWDVIEANSEETYATPQAS